MSVTILNEDASNSTSQRIMLIPWVPVAWVPVRYEILLETKQPRSLTSTSNCDTKKTWQFRWLINPNFSSLFSLSLHNHESTTSAERKATETSYRPATISDYMPANRDDFVTRVAGHLSQSILLRRIAMHHKASAAFVLGDLHCKALPVERIPLTRLPGGEGPGRRPVRKGQRVRRVRWPLIDSFTPRRSPIVRRLFYLLRRAFTYIFEASSRSPCASLCFSLPADSIPLTRYFVSRSFLLRSPRVYRSQEVGNFSIHISCWRVAFEWPFRFLTVLFLSRVRLNGQIPLCAGNGNFRSTKIREPITQERIITSR